MECLYKEYARIYDTIYFKEPQYRKEVNFIENIGGGERMEILDLCGGTGSHANMLIGDGHLVTIVDRSEDMLNVARNKNQKIKTIYSDIFEYGFDSNYDMVLCMYGAIHYNKDLQQIQKLIEKIRQHLKPGGKVLFDLRYSDNLPEDNGLEENNGWWNRKFWRIKKGVGGSDIYVVTAFNRKEHFLDVHNLYHCDPFLYKNMFENAGFVDVSLYDGYTRVPFDPANGGNIVVLVATC